VVISVGDEETDLW